MKLASILLSIGALALALPAANAAFPDKQIEIVVPFAAGGATDLVARQVADGMSKTLNQSVIVMNKPGASGAIGSGQVARAKPDGYTLLLGVTTTHGINPTFNHKLGYDPIKDFTPISLLATMPHVLLVNPSMKADNLNEFIALAKDAKPAFAYGSAGEGSPQHLAGVLLSTELGFDARHVPYKGGSPALVDLIGGRLQFMSSGLSEATPFITSGKLRALAVASEERVPGLDVPTFAESGHPFQLTAWYALFGPADMPQEVVGALNQAARKALQSPHTQEAFKKLSVTAVGSSPDELLAHEQNELERWSKAVQKAGIQPIN